MAASAGLKSKGTVLTRDGNAIAEITSINFPGKKADKIDFTNYDSDDDYKEIKSGMKDGGDVTLEGNFIKGDTNGQIGLDTDLEAGTLQSFVLTLYGGATWTFTAIVTAFNADPGSFDGKQTFSATLSISGKPTLAVSTVTGMSACGFSNDVLMMPTFAIGVYRYVVTITAGQTSTVITPVDASDGEIITIYTDGGSAQVVASGTASSACSLDVDDTTVITIVISHASKASKTYTFNCAVLAT